MIEERIYGYLGVVIWLCVCMSFYLTSMNICFHLRSSHSKFREGFEPGEYRTLMRFSEKWNLGYSSWTKGMFHCSLQANSLSQQWPLQMLWRKSYILYADYSFLFFRSTSTFSFLYQWEHFYMCVLKPIWINLTDLSNSPFPITWAAVVSLLLLKITFKIHSLIIQTPGSVTKAGYVSHLERNSGR